MPHYPHYQLSGGALATLLSEYLPDWKEKRILEFIQELRDKFEEVADKVDSDYVKSKEFAFLFEQTFQNVIKNYKKEKLDAFKAILVNCCTSSKLRNSEKEYFVSLVERLQSIHILILSLFWDKEKFKTKHNINEPKSTIVGNLGDTILTMLRPFGFHKDLVFSAVRDLDSMGLLKGVANALGGTMTADGARDLRVRLSSFGERFCEFISLE